MRQALFLLFFLSLSSCTPAALPPEAVTLRDRGLAELENERPEKAEEIYRRLVQMVPDDPLPHANLAIAFLRQQKYDDATAAIGRALEKAPGRPELLAIQAEIRQWQGELEGALELLRRAVEAAPEDLEILYSAYQLATTVESEAADELAGEVLERLAELRPENVVVLLQLGQRAIAEGDRAGATRAFLRIAQLLWQADPVAGRALQMVTDALREGEVGAARVPAARLENVLKISPMFRESLRELRTGIQGIPLQRFADEPAPASFGEPIAIELRGSALDSRPTAGRGLATGDFDGDRKPDLARLRAGEPTTLEIRLAKGGFKVAGEHPAAGATALLAADVDNDGHLDLAVFGPGRGAVWLGAGDGTFAAAPEALGLAATDATAAAAIDFDIDGDLDVVTAGGAGADLFRNALSGPLERVGERSLPRLELERPAAVVASDLDRDGDLDLALAHSGGVSRLDNLRQGRFERRGDVLAPGAPLADLVSADLDNDGRPELVGAGRGLTVWRNTKGGFERASLAGLPSDGDFTAVVAFDADNDGRLDLAATGPAGVRVWTQKAGAGFGAVSITGAPATASALVAADLDSDGDLDLALGGPEGLHRLENRGGERNRFLAVRLRGLDQGNSKNNLLGVGSVVEVRNGRAYQFREATGDVVHFGLGSQPEAEVLRVVWTNGVPQNRLDVEGNQRVVEEQVLKGSCPFLYAWDGEGYAFVTDLLWSSPLGLPLAPGVWAPADPAELVRVDGLAEDGGRYRLRITEELWEAAFFDQVRLWVVDHPVEVEVASSLRIQPGEQVEDRVLASRDLRPVTAVLDGAGRDATAAVARRDEIYADGYRESPYQGMAAEPWSLTFDLGEVPDGPVRLHLDGWIFPTDASLNLALAQRRDFAWTPPRLEVETAAGWRVLVPSTGHFAGKTKTLVLDLPPLPEGARRLRLTTTLWLHYDRVAWTTRRADDEPEVRARLAPEHAELRFRGFSRLRREAPNAPHAYDYAQVRTESPWLPFPGRYTRYGDVRPLLEAADDLSVILGPGDELELEFATGGLPPLRAGWKRTLFLESHGWDKDADRNTYEAKRLEPLPFRAMSGYPYGDDEAYPDTPAHRAYRRDWLTREVRSDQGR